MPEPSEALRILLHERPKAAPSVSEELVKQILEIEERIQFDLERPEAVTKIKRAVDATIIKESMQESEDGHANQAG